MTHDADLALLLKSCEPIAIALSGGTDSSVLLAYARRHGIRAIAISVDTGLTPPGEIGAARASRSVSASRTSLYRSMRSISLRSGRTGRTGATPARGR